MSREVPWAVDEAARASDEQRVAALVGRRVVGVRYFELPWSELGGPPGPAWPGEGFDALDFGLELDLDDGSTWSFIWLQAGENEGLLAYDGPLQPTQLRQHPGRIWDVGEESGWRDILGRPVVRVDGAWLRYTSDVRGRFGRRFRRRSSLCVHTWVLRFAGDRAVVVALGERAEDGSYRYIHENVAVFFSLEAARSRGVLLPDDPQTV